jgi:hypothetical protein
LTALFIIAQLTSTKNSPAVSVIGGRRRDWQGSAAPVFGISGFFRQFCTPIRPQQESDCKELGLDVRVASYAMDATWDGQQGLADSLAAEKGS